MILSMVLDFENNGLQFMLLKYLRFFDLCKKNNWVMISHEEFDMYEMNFPNRNEYKRFMKDRFHYETYTYEERKEVETYYLSKELFSKLTKEYGSQLGMQMHLLNERNTLLEEELFPILDQISRNEKIDAVLCFAAAPQSVKEYVAKKNIPIIFFERGPIRESGYNIDTSYFSFNDFYGIEEIEYRYNKFIQEQKTEQRTMLSRKEILLMFLSDDNVKYVNAIDANPNYEIGVAGGVTLVVPYFAKNMYMDHELINDVIEQYDYQYNKILFRLHPGDVYTSTYRLNKTEKSSSPIPFIVNSKRIAAVGSNVLFEAMLWKRIAVSMTEVMPATLFASKDYKEEVEKEGTNAFVNFFVFCFLVPEELAYDEKYIIWRLSKPSENEIFDFHLNYYKEHFGLNDELFLEECDERLNILKAYRDVDDEMILPKLDLQSARLDKATYEEYEMLKQWNKNILNSTSWKLTKFVRTVGDFLKGTTDDK